MGLFEGILAYVLVIGIVLYVLYAVIRRAVRDGIVDASKRVRAVATTLDENRE